MSGTKHLIIMNLGIETIPTLVNYEDHYKLKWMYVLIV